MSGEKQIELNLIKLMKVLRHILKVPSTLEPLRRGGANPGRLLGYSKVIKAAELHFSIGQLAECCANLDLQGSLIVSICW